MIVKKRLEYCTNSFISAGNLFRRAFDRNHSMPRFIGIVVILMMSACSPYQQLTKDFTQGQNSLAYSYRPYKHFDAPKNPSVKLLTPVISTTFRGGEVKKVSSEVIPLLVFNSWNHTYECVLGRNQIKENVPEFIATSLREDCNRSGTFKLTKDSTVNYSLEIEIDSISSKGPYRKSGFWLYLVIAWYRHRVDYASTGKAFCSYHYKLRKGEQVVLDNIERVK
jgi:hypothetical protein